MPDIQLNQLAEINPLRPKIDLNLTDEVSFIPMSDVSESGRWVNHQSRQFGDVSRGYTYFEEGDVLFAKITPCMENGKGCYPRNLVNGIGFASTEFHVMRAKDNADPGFIYQWSIYKPLRLKASATMIGSAGQQRVPASFLKSLKVPAIAKQEQTKIAKILSTVDRAIEQTEALIAKQQRIKTSLMQDLLTRGIDEHGNLRSEQTHQFKDSPLGRIPVEWDVGPISEFSPHDRSYLRTGPFGTDLNTKHWIEDGVPVLTIGSLGEGVVLNDKLLYVAEATARKLKGFFVREGDIVFSRVADIGRSLLVQSHQTGWIISSNLMRISLDQARGRPAFLYRSIASNDTVRAQLRITSNSGGRDLVNREILSNLVFPWPQPEEQDRINERTNAIERQIVATEDQLYKYNKLKIAITHDLLTGKRPPPPPPPPSPKKKD